MNPDLATQNSIFEPKCRYGLICDQDVKFYAGVRKLLFKPVACGSWLELFYVHIITTRI